MRSALDGPHVHRVLVSDEFNAGIVQIPRLGMFGWLRNYLVVGLPLMKALTPAEFRAVLAHEFGHLSGNHGRFSGWIYRIRQSWIQVLVRVHEQRRYAAFLFERFLNWYAPFFNAYSFVLARAQEYEADAYSVDLAGRDTAARALVRLDAKERALQEEFWPAFYRQSHDNAQPPRDPFAQMLTGLGRSIDGPTAEKWLFSSAEGEDGLRRYASVTRRSPCSHGLQIGEAAGDYAVPEALLKTNEPAKLTAAEYLHRDIAGRLIPSCDVSGVSRSRRLARGHKLIQEKRAR